MILLLSALVSNPLLQTIFGFRGHALYASARPSSVNVSRVTRKCVHANGAHFLCLFREGLSWDVKYRRTVAYRGVRTLC